MGEARRRREGASKDFVRLFQPGERDLTVGEIVSRAAKLIGPLASVYTMTNLAEKMRDPLTGAVFYPKRFVLARFRSWRDRHLPEAQRAEEILGTGCSWDEAFARAESRLRARVA